jgi:adenosine deaminase
VVGSATSVGEACDDRDRTRSETVWPTAELHVHIEGTLDAGLIRTLADRNGLAVPAGAGRGAPYRDLQEFLDVYYANLDVLRTRQDFQDLGARYLARAAAAGVRHVEVFVDPQSHTERGVPVEDVLLGLSAALADARADHGMSGGLIVCFLRHLGPAAAMATLEAVLPHRPLLLGVGLDSSEVGFPPALFRDVYERAAAEGLRRVAHAGEEGGPDYVWEALDILGAERIDHGNRALEDVELVAHLRETRTPLTVCPLSNVALGTAGPDLADHPIAVMLDEGLRASVHSDDPAYFGGYLDDNLAALVQAGTVTQDQLGVLAANAVVSSFLPDGAKAALLAEVRAHAESIGAAVPALALDPAAV